MNQSDLLSGDIERLAIGWLIQQGFVRSPHKVNYDRVPDVEYGDHIEIHWGGLMKGVVDIGLVVPFPGQDELDANMGGLVWIQSPDNPDNPGGKDSVKPQWGTLHMLRTSPYVEYVKVLKKRETTCPQVKEKNEASK